MIGTKRTKKVISWLLCIATVLTILPMSAFAAETEVVMSYSVATLYDIDEDDWYYEDVEYAVQNGLFNGTTETTFAPNGIITRAMMVTVLYRADGEPEMKDAQWFEDVAKGQWYSNAVAWATFNGITVGYGAGNFGPDDYITREQIAAIMHRYAQYKGIDVSVGENTNILSYDDFADISEYAIAATQYTCGSGLMKGKTESTLNPLDNATRAEIAAILHRFLKGSENTMAPTILYQGHGSVRIETPEGKVIYVDPYAGGRL